MKLTIIFCSLLFPFTLIAQNRPLQICLDNPAAQWGVHFLCKMNEPAIHDSIERIFLDIPDHLNSAGKQCFESCPYFTSTKGSQMFI